MSNIREEYKCAKKSKFMQAILIGALAGAAVSLFDKNTRGLARGAPSTGAPSTATAVSGGATGPSYHGDTPGERPVARGVWG